MIITPGTIDTKQFHAYLLGSVAPRPICFASTVDQEGNPNLSPFSFFNAFGSNPPICVFSPARRVRNNTIKHTLENIRETQEVVINVVTYEMVQQTSLASCEYPKGVNEFIKSGFTPLPSEIVKPFRVKESPVNLECKVLQVIETGQHGGAANLIICEIVRMHLDEKILGADGQIDPDKIDLVARMGKDYYCRASGAAVFEVPKPNLQLGIGFDNLPEPIRKSDVLRGNDLGMLANSTEIPKPELNAALREQINEIKKNSGDQDVFVRNLHEYARKLLAAHKIDAAWQILLAGL